MSHEAAGYPCLIQMWTPPLGASKRSSSLWVSANATSRNRRPSGRGSGEDRSEQTYPGVQSQLVWKGSSGFRPMRSYEEVVAAASLVTAVGITSRSALLEMAEAEDRPDAASFGQLSRHDEQALLLRAR